MNIDFDTGRYFYELQDFVDDDEIIAAAEACVAAQRKAGERFLESSYQPCPGAKEAVSAEALEKLIATGDHVIDIGTHREISNCLSFTHNSVQNVEQSRDLERSRARMDEVMGDRMRALFGQDDLVVDNSGLLWYPPGGYMGWHTNQRSPGWRMYINATDEPGKSYFRYRDPETEEIVTAPDKRWNFRLFRIGEDVRFWHAIYSDTNRFSLGYRITRRQAPTVVSLLRRTVRRFVGRT